MNAARLRIPWAAVAALALAGCEKPAMDRIQGYVEGEYVYVASPLAGTLESLAVARGDHVAAGAKLFALESKREKAAREEMSRRLAEARAKFEDARKGKRPTEIDSLEAQVRLAEAAKDYSEREMARQESLYLKSAAAMQEFDKARSTLEQELQRVTQLKADLKTARLGSREDQIAAAEAGVKAAEATVAQADWDLEQKTLAATQTGLVFDTLFRPGEWVAAGKPVVALLPPANVKVRAFVPETKIGGVKIGQAASVLVDGVAAAAAGKVSFISPRAEFTPPVIYSRESRSKLVFMIEIRFDGENAAKLHPGQPVDVKLGD